MSASCTYRAAHADGPMAMTSSESSHVIPANGLTQLKAYSRIISSSTGRFSATSCNAIAEENNNDGDASV